MSHAVDGTYIKAQQDKMVNSSLCKKASVDTYFNVMEVNLIIYNGKNKGDLVVKNNEKFNITKCGIDVFTL